MMENFRFVQKKKKEEKFQDENSSYANIYIYLFNTERKSQTLINDPMNQEFDTSS